MKKIILIIILVLALVLGGGYFFLKSSLMTNSRSDKISFQDIGELATQEADVVQVETISKDFLKEKYNIQLPFVGTNVVYSYTVVVKAGFDFTEIEAQVHHDNKKVDVTLPEPEVLSADIVTDSFVCYLDNQSIFNQLSQEDQNAALTQLKEDARQTALDNGLLDKAKANGESLLKNMIIGQLEGEDYTIKFSYRN